MSHFVSATCRGHRCWCGQEATHKVGEEIPPDDPVPARHNLTSYICCTHFLQLMGPSSGCFLPRTDRSERWGGGPRPLGWDPQAHE
jgi:hypothetical protein